MTNNWFWVLKYFFFYLEIHPSGFFVANMDFL